MTRVDVERRGAVVCALNVARVGIFCSLTSVNMLYFNTFGLPTHLNLKPYPQTQPSQFRISVITIRQIFGSSDCLRCSSWRKRTRMYLPPSLLLFFTSNSLAYTSTPAPPPLPSSCIGERTFAGVGAALVKTLVRIVSRPSITSLLVSNSRSSVQHAADASASPATRDARKAARRVAPATRPSSLAQRSALSRQ